MDCSLLVHLENTWFISRNLHVVKRTQVDHFMANAWKLQDKVPFADHATTILAALSANLLLKRHMREMNWKSGYKLDPLPALNIFSIWWNAIDPCLY
jgi:hypothetical protein